VKRFLLGACLVVSVLLAAASALLFGYYHDGHLPHAPQPANARIHASSNHGDIVYLTQREAYLMMGLNIAAAAIFLVGFVANGRWKVFGPYPRSPQLYRGVDKDPDYRAVRRTYQPDDTSL